MPNQSDIAYKILELKHPFERTSGDIVTELKFRRLSAGDLRASSDKDEIKLSLKLLARSCGLADVEFDKVDIEDVTKAGDLIADFLP